MEKKFLQVFLHEIQTIGKICYICENKGAIRIMDECDFWNDDHILKDCQPI